MTISKPASLAFLALAISLPGLASAGDSALQLNQDSQTLPLRDDSVLNTPAITYRTQPVATETGYVDQYVAEAQVDGFLICNEFASEGNSANVGVRLRPVHGGWVIGSYDDSSSSASAVTPGETSPYYLQGSFARINGLGYSKGVLGVSACDAEGNGPGCTGSEPWPSGGAALQCYTASSDGGHVADSSELFSSGFDDYSASNNSFVKILDVSPPHGSQETYDYTVQWSLPAGTAPKGRYILQLGYDQAVFSKCGTMSGSTISTKLRDEPTTSGILYMHCSLPDPMNPPPTGNAPVVVAALFTSPNGRETEYTDNVAFGRMSSSGATATLSVNVFDDGTVTAGASPSPLFGDIYLCGSSGGSNCAATYAQGVNVNLQATPGAGHHFVSWNGACTGSSPNFSVAMNLDRQCGALFAINSYTLSYTAGANGTVTGSTTQSVDYGSNGTAVTAVPNANYHFTQWTPGGSTDNPRTDANVAGDISVMANFAIDQYTVTGQSSGHGTVSPSSQQVDYNASTSLTATPDTGYHVASGSGCGGSLDGNTYYTGAIVADCTVSVDFAIDQFTVTAAVAGGNGGISPPSQTVSYGDAATFTLSPDAGYELASISGDTCTVSGSGANYSASNIQGNCAVTAQYSIRQYNVTATVSGGHGSITPSSQTISWNGTASFTVTPDSGYHVDSIGGDTCSPTGSGSSYSAIHILADCAVSVTFAAD